jgi:hypothetical protein
MRIGGEDGRMIVGRPAGVQQGDDDVQHLPDEQQRGRQPQRRSIDQHGCLSSRMDHAYVSRMICLARLARIKRVGCAEQCLPKYLRGLLAPMHPTIWRSYINEEASR